MPPSFFSLATTIVLGLPLSVWLAAVAFAIAAFMLRYHRLGRALYAIGGNPEAARAAGIRVERITWGVFILGSMLASLGGLIVTGYVGAINANQGNGMIFTVFAAAVIGGISLDGGKGTMIGALSGVLLLGVVQNLLTLAQVPSFWIQAIYGAIILGSLMVARARERRRPELTQRSFNGLTENSVDEPPTRNRSATDPAQSGRQLPDRGGAVSSAGTQVQIDGESVTLVADHRTGAQGGAPRSGGRRQGAALRRRDRPRHRSGAANGEHLHTHNLESDYLPTYTHDAGHQFVHH